jgi:hypothetical protein
LNIHVKKIFSIIKKCHVRVIDEATERVSVGSVANAVAVENTCTSMPRR